MFGRRVKKDNYSLNIKEYSFDAPKISKQRKPRRSLKLVAGTLLSLMMAMTLTGGVTVSANASDKNCIINATDNKGFASLGGLTTASMDGAKTNASDKNNGSTIRNKWGEKVTFTTWVPMLRTTTDTTVPIYNEVIAKDWGTAWTNVDTEASESIGTGKWDAPTNDLIRQGESNKKNIADLFNDGLMCGMSVGGAILNDTFPNFLFLMAKGINNMVVDLYAQATTGGTNITNVVGLKSDMSGVTNLDQGYITTDENDSWMQELGTAIEEALVGKDGQDGLYDTLYLPFLAPLLMIGAAVVLFNGIRTRAVKALTGIIWMLVVVTSAMLFFQAPMVVPKVIDGLVGVVGTGVSEAVLAPSSGNPCTADQSYVDESGKPLSEAKQKSEEIQCLIWFSTIYKPWVEGQFGVNYGEQESLRTDQKDYIFQDKNGVLTAAKMTNLGWPAYMLENYYGPKASNVGIAQSQLQNEHFFKNSDKIGPAFTALITSLSLGAFIGVNSILILAYQMSMLLLLLVAPLFFVIGIVPSPMGKGIFMRWLEMVVGIGVKRLIMTLILVVFVKLFLIISDVQSIDIWMKAILFGIVGWIGLSQRSKIIEMFTGKINFGGDKNINVGSGLEAIGHKAPDLIKGAAKMGVVKAGDAAKTQVRRGAATAAGKSLDRKLINKTDEERKNILDKRAKKVGSYDDANGLALSGGGYGGGSGSRSVMNAARARSISKYQNGEGGYDFSALDAKRDAIEAKKNAKNPNYQNQLADKEQKAQQDASNAALKKELMARKAERDMAANEQKKANAASNAQKLYGTSNKEEISRLRGARKQADKAERQSKASKAANKLLG